jgi:RHS repeat-associated protein
VGIHTSKAGAGNPLRAWEFSYDGFGRRLKMVYRQGLGPVTATAFVWDNANIIEQRSGDGSQVLKRYYGQGVQIVGGNQAGNYYYTSDHLGSIRELVDSNDMVRARYDYGLWGERIKVSGDLDADFGYAGYFELADTQIKLTWFRAYNAIWGRWVSRDPIGEEADANLYRYVQ